MKIGENNIYEEPNSSKRIKEPEKIHINNKGVSNKKKERKSNYKNKTSQINNQKLSNCPIIMSPNMIQLGMATNAIIPYGMIPAVDPISILQLTPQVKIKQTVEWLEVITGCETKNRYIIFAKINEQNLFLFKCKEESGCLMRNCCPGDCRAFILRLSHSYQKNFIYLDRPFKCTCCCCGRPEMICKYYNGVQFGRIKEPCTLCNPFFETYDEFDGSKYFLEIPCCQCGFCCRDNICGKCSEVYGNIYNANNLNIPVGIIEKKVKCCQETFTDANTFIINFPVDSTIGDKLNLIASVLLIDYRYYEDNANQKKSGNRCCEDCCEGCLSCFCEVASSANCVIF